MFFQQIHWTVANSAHIAARTQLNENHPIRRVTKAFIYGTGAINMLSTIILAGENNLFHQLTGFTYNGFSNLQRYYIFFRNLICFCSLSHSSIIHSKISVQFPAKYIEEVFNLNKTDEFK